MGSSPLTRGKRTNYINATTKRGLIPAHAGKTRGRASCSTSATAHPRSRGENSGGQVPDHAYPGSSPLTRGKPRHHVQMRHEGRLIPAHAGKTRCKDSCQSYGAAHPRSRGENKTARTTSRAACGSSPLTRGKRTAQSVQVLSEGLIPAHAGKTQYAGRSSARSPAHPRSRGENGPSTVRVTGKSGSSPLTRGKPWAVTPLTNAKRLIPAHAGKTKDPRRAI